MNVPNSLTSHADTTALSTYTTPSSYTPTPNALVLAWIVNTKASPVSTPTSVTGNGLTWVLVAGVENALTNYRGSFYRAMGASPSNGALSVNFSGNQNGCAIHVFEIPGVDTSGTNGSGAIVQNNTNLAAGAANLTITLGAFGDVNNGAIAGFGGARNVGINPDTGGGWTEIYDNGYGTPATEAESQYITTNNTSVTGTWSASTADIFGVAIEVKHATTATRIKDPIVRGVIVKRR